MLSALKVPETGGETQLMPMQAGYDSLSDEIQEMIADLGAYHSTEFSQANDLGDFFEAGQKQHLSWRGLFSSAGKSSPRDRPEMPVYWSACFWYPGYGQR